MALDVRWLFGITKGYYLSSSDAKEFAKHIEVALKYNEKTNGRERILELGLDSRNIAFKIKAIYKDCILDFEGE